ncbi:hypothetical protein PHYBLDRAFT_173492 [Phycomyces blakesleeanus NRRL 1555(-)]|uniref:Uncharacterized protein n=1 Tax=Phycomyces blakesleeanus (strain ATCC 8743b / DSM 1359 / FGSC 10004 / NBRC 33097 / NRRL 1555) TaxID=763407 RepID=A0A162TGX8_PHYB8|nr:hypothetical protein PHYBLDRAFT_173492 [Phycomyces blakesleeanus NRRL 1555(-)]OAD68502.1 hypothetical protein PHYBLDRAFT_173492 [Phycomyces blakesleeanus NRRL 1555(-)]|eukprot:XP_018286542.1 hypothetical protein PHYBLDRAFT_173492 [Phycomyces blakesleeanus NRRL 1555(-)]
MRPTLYPAAEELIRNKKQQKLDEQEQGLQEKALLLLKEKHNNTLGELRAKKAAYVLVVCNSCGAQGHSTKRSPICPNHDMTLLQLLNRDLGPHQRYTLSITLDSFISNNDHIQRARGRIIVQSSFLREVLPHHYPRLQHLQALYTEPMQTNGVNLTVSLNGLKNYGAVVSSACMTIATTYNNCYYLSIMAIENIVYEHLLY